MFNYNNEVVDILMSRDGMSKADAKDYYETVLTEIEDAIAIGDYSLAEEMFESDLGLELDFLF